MSPTPLFCVSPSFSFRSSIPATCSTPTPTPTPSPRSTLLSLLNSCRSNATEITSILPVLESPPSSSTLTSLLPGSWLAVHISQPETASPIQRLVSSIPGLFPTIEQLVLPGPSRLINRVQFRAPFPVVLNVAAAVEEVDGNRLKVRFDEAWFQGVGEWKWRLAYPVPFKLLGKKAAGWIDVTYLDEELRIVRGSKSTAFVLIKRVSNEIDYNTNLEEYLQSSIN